jgi:hypothetical protein
MDEDIYRLWHKCMHKDQEGSFTSVYARVEGDSMAELKPGFWS